MKMMDYSLGKITKRINMNILKLERKCSVCNGSGFVTVDNVYYLRDLVDKFKKNRSDLLLNFLEGNQLSLNIKESPMEINAKRRLDVAVDSIELDYGDCRECQGRKIILTEDGKNILEFFKRHGK